MILLFFGAILSHSGRTICGCLRALGMKGEAAFANYHHWLSRCKIDMLQGSKILIKMLLPLAGTTVVFVVDEHLERRRGSQIKAKATYRDPVASSQSRIVKCFGLKWVVLSMLVTFSWSSRPFALPVCCVLRYPENHPKNLKRKLKTGTDIICQILIMIRRWFPDMSITILGDGDYARTKLCIICNRLSIDLVSRMRKDARLHDYVSEGKRKGRRPKVGNRLAKPKEEAQERLNIRWYGGVLKEVLVYSRNCLWLAGKESLIIPIKAVWVQLRSNDHMILMATNLNMEAWSIIEAYVKRWNIEVTFRECREHLGIETQRQWSDLAVDRATPFLFGLYTIITLIGNEIYKLKGFQGESTAWYKKSSLTFSDLLKVVRESIGDISVIVNSLLKPEFGNDFKEQDHHAVMGAAA